MASFYGEHDESQSSPGSVHLPRGGPHEPAEANMGPVWTNPLP